MCHLLFTSQLSTMKRSSSINCTPPAKKPRNRMTIGQKREIIKLLKTGISVKVVAEQYKIGEQTVVYCVYFITLDYCCTIVYYIIIIIDKILVFLL